MSMVEGELVTTALCWRLERRDGIAIGFTTHDRPLEIDGLVYRAAPGMLPSQISLTSSFDASALDVQGALTSDAISERDLLAGRWDGAAVRIFLVDWEQPEGEKMMLARGTLGDVSIGGNGFAAELRGPTAELDQPVVAQTSPECRAQLGDKRCRVGMAGRTVAARIGAVVEDNGVELEGLVAAANLYAYGRLRWLSGVNSGLESAIRTSQGARLTLREPPPFMPAIGDLVEIREGCDKSLATCASRFRNAVNFRGEPHLPGIYLLTRYPGA